MNYRVTKRMEVSAAHTLSLPVDTPCNRPHGHNWTIMVTCESGQLESGVVVDFDEIKTLVHRVLDHQSLNDVPDLPLWLRSNPTAEHLGRWILERVPLCVEVEIWESRNNRCLVTK